MSGNNKPMPPKDFVELVEAALSNLLAQMQTMDNRITKIEDYVEQDIKNKAIVGRTLHDR